jgi:hypothetical protein
LAAKDLRDSISDCGFGAANKFESSGLAVELVGTDGTRRSVLVGVGWSIGDLVDDACRGTAADGHHGIALEDSNGRKLDLADPATGLSRWETYYMIRR